MKRLPGISLLELTVGSTLMGLLFMSGLQLLSSFFLVQTRVVSSQSALNMEPFLLKTQLQQTLQAVDAVEVSPDHLSLNFQHHAETHRLRFESTPQQWLLWQDQTQLAHWPKASQRQTPGFQQPEANLVELQFPSEKTAISIWLRNINDH
jgi:hypothetical protein